MLADCHFYVFADFSVVKYFKVKKLKEQKWKLTKEEENQNESVTFYVNINWKWNSVGKGSSIQSIVYNSHEWGSRVNEFFENCQDVTNLKRGSRKAGDAA